METVIKLTGINKIYRTDEVETQALENVNLEVRKGEFLSIMGPSGCGKSTLLNIMGLLDEPTSGEIELCGTKIDPKLSDNRLAELRNKTLGFVFQSFHLIPTLNVLDNVQLPLIYRGVRSGERIRLAKEVIERVGLSHRMKHRPTQLSGGQCQRVAIARAIIGNPEILLADEPTGNLDSKMGAGLSNSSTDDRYSDKRTTVYFRPRISRITRMIKIIRHAFALIREDKLFSAIYVAGTAVAIASAMVVALILHIRISNIYPEEHRDRTVYLKSYFKNDKGAFVGYSGYSPLAVEELFSHLKCAEVVSANMDNSYVYRFTACEELGKQEMPVTMKFTDANFYRLYDFQFVSGRPYTDEQLQHAEKCIVITDVLARRVFGTTEQVAGRQLLLNYLPYRVVGVVREVSPLLVNSSADVYLPYAVNDSRSHWQSRDVSYAGGLEVTVLLKEGCTYQMLKDELEPYRAKYLSMLRQATGRDYEFSIDAQMHWARTLNFEESYDMSTGDMLYNLQYPALLMLLLLLLPAINLSGLVSNQMEARIAEMGIRKAFGAKRRTLLSEVIHENLVLTLLGGIAGYALSWLFISAMCSNTMFLTLFEREYDPINSVSLQLDMFFTPTLFLIAFVCCAVLNLMAALIPAWSSLRKPIVESLNQKR